MGLGSGIAVTVVQAGGYSSDWTLTWDPLYTMDMALKRQKKKKDACIPIIIVALLKIAMTLKQTKCPSTEV